MKVLKFGGTSVGSASRMKEVVRLIADGERKIVVLSAMSGTTNKLVEISECLYDKRLREAAEMIDGLEAVYVGHVEELYSTDEYREKGRKIIKEHFDYLRSFVKDIFTLYEEKIVLAQGELISTKMVYNYMLEQGYDAAFLPALDFMRTDRLGEPDINYIRKHIAGMLGSGDGCIYITQGFICRNAFNEIDNLQRGGSDYTASLIGAAIDAEEVQIWTDIDGLHNNDPRIVENTSPVRSLTFDEAAELAYFGAKILHPACIIPAKRAGIPVLLLNTMQPEAPGTLIAGNCAGGGIKAVAAKDNITAIKVKSNGRLPASGFLRKVFEIFESYMVPVDMVCTSEMNVAVATDKTAHLDEVADELSHYGEVAIDTDMCIACVVGDMGRDNAGTVKTVVDALAEMPVRMVSYGSSDNNIAFLVRAADKKQALCALSRALFSC